MLSLVKMKRKAPPGTIFVAQLGKDKIVLRARIEGPDRLLRGWIRIIRRGEDFGNLSWETIERNIGGSIDPMEIGI